MTSQRQLEANRANAKRSTGPKTPEGKARSRWNSYNHGLRARILLSGEDEAEFHQLRARLLDEYDPQTTMGAELVEDLARIMLMKQRAGFYEAAILETRREQLLGLPSEPKPIRPYSHRLPSF